MRRALSIALLTIFTWMLIVPFLGPDAEANLPPCCRSNGKHHCACAMARQPGENAGFAKVTEKCPCHPAGVCAVHSVTYRTEPVKVFCVGFQARRGHIAHQVSICRTAFLRTQPKRGPPVPLA